MAEHLPNAPITEAVLDVQVRARPGFEAIEFNSLRETLQSQFPKVTERRQFATSIEFNPESRPKDHHQEFGIDGLVFWSIDGKNVAQFRVDGFSLNRLKPSQGWDLWFPQFQRLWNLYRQIAAPTAVLRIASRCINHIGLDADKTLDEYLRLPPSVPDGLPTTLKGYLARLEMTDSKEPETGVAIVQGVSVDPKGGGPQLLLDIDAYMVWDFRPEEVAGLLDALRILRNTAFFNSLTPQAIASFR